MYSASVAAGHYDGIFVSGFGFAASYYGLPDIGFIAWPDMMGFVQRLRGAFPRHHLLVDIDDGYVDPEVACHVVEGLERTGASGVILEDQKRPRRCGHADGKQVLPLAEYLEKLGMVLATRKDLVVVARTDATEEADIIERAQALAATDADVVLVDGVRSVEWIERIRGVVGGKPLMFNQIMRRQVPAALAPRAGRARRRRRDLQHSLPVRRAPGDGHRAHRTPPGRRAPARWRGRRGDRRRGVHQAAGPEHQPSPPRPGGARQHGRQRVTCARVRPAVRLASAAPADGRGAPRPGSRLPHGVETSRPLPARRPCAPGRWGPVITMRGFGGARFIRRKLRVFSVVVRQDARGVVFALRGELDFESVVQLHGRRDGAGQGKGAGPVVADCSDLQFCDSSGVGALVRFFQQLAAQGRVLRLASVPDSVARLLSLTGLDQVFSVHADVCEALVAGTGGRDVVAAGADGPVRASEGQGT